MLNSFLDKKSLQEITNIFKQHVQYQYSSKDEVADISVSQQDKINRFLNCYQQYFTNYLMSDNTYQHFDYYRILSKYIKVFNLEKGKKFRSNNYDGLYIILKGFVQEIIVQEDPTPEEQAAINAKAKKGKPKQQDQIKMSKIVSMVMGINRMKGSSNDISQRESVQIMPTINNFLEESSNTETLHSESISNSHAGNGVGTSAFNTQKSQQGDTRQKNLTLGGISGFEYLPNSPEPQHVQSKSYLKLDRNQFIDKKRGFEQNNDLNFQDIKRSESGEIVENSNKQENINSPQINIVKSNDQSICQDENMQTYNDQSRNNLKFQKPQLVIKTSKDDKLQLERGDTDAIEERRDDVHELKTRMLHTPVKSPFSGKQFTYSNQSANSSASNQNTHSSSPLKIIDNIQKQNYVEPFQAPVMGLGKASHQLKKKLSFMMALQPKSNTPFPEYANKPFNILANGDIIDLIKISDSQRKYFVQDIEDSICLYIGKKSMEKAFKEQIIQLRFKTAVLEKFFNNVPSNKILKLAYHFYEKTLFKNQLVYKQGDPRPHYIYIIKSGEVQISEKGKSQILKQQVKQDAEDANQQASTSDQQNQQPQSEQDELQSLCRKKLKQSIQPLASTSLKAATLNMVSQTKILCSIGEEEIFGIEEIILQKENREFQAVVSSSQAEFYVIPEDLFENFRQTESESILSWFKQKELFYQQQRVMHKRIKGDKNTPKSSQEHYPSHKKVQQACQYLFQEDEQTFNSRLDQLHDKKIIQLKNYHQYKQYINQKQQSQNSLQSNDSQNINSPRNNSQTADKTMNKEQIENLSRFHPQNQLQKSQILMLSKITQSTQQHSSQTYIDLQGQESELVAESKRKQSAKLNYMDQLKKNLVINLTQGSNHNNNNSLLMDSPYQLTDRLATNRSTNHNPISPASSLSSLNLNGDETNKNFVKPQSARLSTIKPQLQQNDNTMKRSQLQIKKVFSSFSNIQNEPTQLQSNQIQQNKQDKILESYKVTASRKELNKQKSQQFTQTQEMASKKPLLKNIKKGKTTSSLYSIDQDKTHSFMNKSQLIEQQQQQPQCLLQPPPSLEYVSNHNIGQTTSSGDILNLGRIHHMIKSNTQIIKQKLNLKGKNQLFRKPIFDELKSENIKQISKIIQQKSSLLSEEKPKQQYQPLSERWKNTTKNMQNFQKYQEFIKSSQSLNNNLSPTYTTQKDLMQTQSFVNLLTPRSFNSFVPGSGSAKSLTQLETNSTPTTVNIHMENKRKQQRSNEPYFTRPFSRAEQQSQGGDSNFSSHSKHRTLHSSNLKKRMTTQEENNELPLSIQAKRRIEIKSINNFQTIITSQFSLSDRTPRNGNEIDNFQ